MKKHQQPAVKAPSKGVERTKRSANGVSEKPVALRLMPDEREKVERASMALKVSMAKFAADCFRVGLAANQVCMPKAAKASRK